MPVSCLKQVEAKPKGFVPKLFSRGRSQNWLSSFCVVISFLAGTISTSMGQESSETGEKLDATAISLADQELVQIQNRIKGVLPNVLPCVVAIEGGSGVIVHPSGLILTASHVAGHAGRTVKVTLSDGREVQATTLGTNNSTDASALQLNSPGPWPFLPLTSQAEIKQGDWCLALGYPSSFPRNTPAAARLGRIRQVEAEELSSDCVLMGGDSGGPLINLNGDLIGINSRVKTKLHENYHIPNSVFIKQWNQIAAAADIRQRQSPSGQRAYLGLHAETDDNRVRIRKIHARSPAETSGLKPEDVILQFDGERITDFEQILKIVDGRKPGETVKLIVNRSGRLQAVYLVLGRQY